jgi:recyclin-1
MEEVDYILATRQLATDFNPGVSSDPHRQTMDVGISEAATAVVDVVSSHTQMLVGSTDKSTLDVFNQEVGLRLFTALCKHLKRQRISVEGSLKLISDMNHYFKFIQGLRNQELLLYFKAFRELAQIYLIDPSDAKELATIIADADRFQGIWRVEEVYEFAERRADWFQVKKDVERAMYGIGCSVM